MFSATEIPNNSFYPLLVKVKWLFQKLTEVINFIDDVRLSASQILQISDRTAIHKRIAHR